MNTIKVSGDQRLKFQNLTYLTIDIESRYFGICHLHVPKRQKMAYLDKQIKKGGVNLVFKNWKNSFTSQCNGIWICDITRFSNNLASSYLLFIYLICFEPIYLTFYIIQSGYVKIGYKLHDTSKEQIHCEVIVLGQMAYKQH